MENISEEMSKSFNFINLSMITEKFVKFEFYDYEEKMAAWKAMF